MPNISRVFGLRPTKSASAGVWTGQARKYFVPASDATALMIGDPVKLTGASDANGVGVVTRVTANTDIPVGVMVGLEIVNGDVSSPTFRRASTATYIWVMDDPAMEMEIQASGAFIYATDVALNVGFTFTAGNTVFGTSGVQADMATKATTATLPLVILGVVQRPDADMADTANAKIRVKFRNHAYANAVAGV